MKYLLFLVYTIIIMSFTVCNLIKHKVVSLETIKKEYRQKKAILILTAIACFLITYAIQAFIYNSTDIWGFIKLCTLYAILLSAALIDYKFKIIPNMLTLIGLGVRGVIYVFEFFFTDNLLQVLVNDLIGFGIGFGILAIVSIITKQALGFGDVKLFAVIGLMLGAFGTYSVLFASVVVSTIISIGLLVSKRKGRKDSIPFGPCIFMGYILVILLGSY